MWKAMAENDENQEKDQNEKGHGKGKTEKSCFKSLNFLMQYALNKCSPEFCPRVIAMGEMGSAPLQSPERFIPPQLHRHQTEPVAKFLAEKGIRRGNKEDMQQFLVG